MTRPASQCRYPSAGSARAPVVSRSGKTDLTIVSLRWDVYFQGANYVLGMMGGLQGRRVTAQVFCRLETAIATKVVLKACLATHPPRSSPFVRYQLRCIVSLEGLEKLYIWPLSTFCLFTFRCSLYSWLLAFHSFSNQNTGAPG